MDKVIVLTGPESTGKTTLANSLSDYLKRPVLKEYAREYLTDFEGEYDLNDVLAMAETQYLQGKELIKHSENKCILDTDLLVYKIWLQVKFNHEEEWIERALKDHQHKIYLLMNIDLEWEEDPLREHHDFKERSHLFQLYEKALQEKGLNYHIIEGKGEIRLKKALDFLTSSI